MEFEGRTSIQPCIVQAFRIMFLLFDLMAMVILVEQQNEQEPAK